MAFSAPFPRQLTLPSRAPSPAGKTRLDAFYELVDGSYVPRATVTDDQLVAALLVIKAKSIVTGTIFGAVPTEEAAGRRIIIMSQTERNSLLAAAGSETGAFLQSVVSGGTTYYIQRLNLGTTEGDDLKARMAIYRRDAEIFPYYAFDSASGRWKLKKAVSQLTPEERSDIESKLYSAGLWTWTVRSKWIEYRSQALLPFAQTKLPGDSFEDEITPSGGISVAARRDTSYVEIPASMRRGRLRFSAAMP